MTTSLIIRLLVIVLLVLAIIWGAVEVFDLDMHRR